MIYGKKKLMKHFQEEIDRVASLELKVIEDQKEDLKEEALQNEQAKLEVEFQQRYRKKVNQLNKQYATLKAKLDSTSKQEIYQAKKQFQDNVLKSVAKELKIYVNSDAYFAQLNQNFKALNDVKVYVGRVDQKHIDAWQKAHPSLSFEVKPQIQIGGYQVFDEAKHVLYDFSLDARFEEEQKSFFTSVLSGGVSHV